MVTICRFVAHPEKKILLVLNVNDTQHFVQINILNQLLTIKLKEFANKYIYLYINGNNNKPY